jgi:uncharacterized protein (DUF2267 family)
MVPVTDSPSVETPGIGVPDAGSGDIRLFRRARRADMDDETFTRSAAERAGLPEPTVERIEHATLSTLAARITGGEARDLAERLPDAFQDDLEKPREEAEAFDVEEFVRRVAQRAQVSPEEARTGATAVLITVREAAGDEFRDALSQLPQEYRELVGPWA